MKKLIMAALFLMAACSNPVEGGPEPKTPMERIKGVWVEAAKMESGTYEPNCSTDNFIEFHDTGFIDGLDYGAPSIPLTERNGRIFVEVGSKDGGEEVEILSDMAIKIGDHYFDRCLAAGTEYAGVFQPEAPYFDLTEPEFTGRNSDYKNMKSAILEELKNTGVSFASHYSIIRVGCGTGCTTNLMINRKTGEIFPIPFSGQEFQLLQLWHTVKGDMLTARWQKEGLCKRQVAIWNGKAFEMRGMPEIDPDQSMCGEIDISAIPQDIAYDNPGGDCNATVLEKVTAREDETATMSPGELWIDVTQFWKNNATGESWFCAHGDYCYPNSVIKNGKRTKAIELNNCTIGKPASDHDDEVLYYLEPK